eukprot:340196-Rhodomonas_salina.3
MGSGGQLWGSPSAMGINASNSTRPTIQETMNQSRYDKAPMRRPKQRMPAATCDDPHVKDR